MKSIDLAQFFPHRIENLKLLLYTSRYNNNNVYMCKKNPYHIK